MQFPSPHATPATAPFLQRRTAGWRRILAATAAAWGLSFGALAHNVWLEPEADGSYLLQFGGHAGQVEAFDPAKLRSVTAYDRRGRKVGAEVKTAAHGMKVYPGAQATLLAVELDNGFFSGQPGVASMVPLPMDQHPGATRGVWARKYHKTVMVWGAFTQTVLGQKFEVVPLQGQVPHAGQALALQVLLDGQPLAGARISQGESGSPVVTDAQGKAAVRLVPGTNVIQAIYRQPVQGDTRATEFSYEHLLRFAVH